MQNPTPTDETTDTSTDQLSPADVAGLFPREEREVSRDDKTPIERLLKTPTRVSVLATLASVPAAHLPMTVAEICERAEAVTKSSFSKHKDDLLKSGVLEVADEVGGTTRYQLNDDHPVAQAWSMLVTVAHFGRTPQLIDGRFLGEPDDILDDETAARVEAAARGGVGIDRDVVDGTDSVKDLSRRAVLETDDPGNQEERHS